MINPWLILGVLLAWLGSLASVGYWQHQAGVTVTVAAYEKKQIEADAKSAAVIAAKSAKILEGETQHAKDQALVNFLAAESGSVPVHIPAAQCGRGAKGGADPNRAGGLLSAGVDAAFAKLQNGVDRLVQRCDQLNIDAIASNTANK